ncbi:MAG: hypothetical protein AAGD28_25295 [Bacteroidota bacterium]
MKITQRVILMLVAGTLLFSCNQAKLDQLEKENKELTEQNQMQDSLMNDFISTFNEFEENLAVIKEKEQMIEMSAEDPELRKSSKDQIVSDIQMINDLLDRNRTLIDDLTAKVEKSERNNRRYLASISRLKKQLEERDTEVSTLKDELATMSFTVESLNGKVDTLNQVTRTLTEETNLQTARIAEQESQIGEQLDQIENQTTALNTAFYVMGSSKELKDKAVMNSKRLNNNFDEGAFTKINITEVQTIPLNTKKAKLLTSHPSDSYVLNEEGKEIASLEITNPERFWKTSKYLVVVTN